MNKLRSQNWFSSEKKWLWAFFKFFSELNTWFASRRSLVLSRSYNKQLLQTSKNLTVLWVWCYLTSAAHKIRDSRMLSKPRSSASGTAEIVRVVGWAITTWLYNSTSPENPSNIRPHKPYIFNNSHDVSSESVNMRATHNNWGHISHRFRVMTAYWSKFPLSREFYQILTSSFGVNHWTQNHKFWPRNRNDHCTMYVRMLNRFDVVHECDKQTEGQKCDSNSGVIRRGLIQEKPAVADKHARRLRKVCTVYVRAVEL